MSAVPVNYRLEFEPAFEDFTFKGREWITVDCPEPTDTITLNASEIVIHRCRVHVDPDYLDAATELDEESEEMSVRVSRKITGRCVIHVEFTGCLNDRLLGLYRSRYGDARYLATTQFEAADARRAFPCWDRPDAKATFEISITCDAGLAAISNMPEISCKAAGQKAVHRFAKTPVMSTYLVYVGAGDFEHIQGMSGDTQIRVIAVRGSASRGAYALDAACRLLAAYEEYFGIAYPLPKLDLIAVPDFAAGAMENWGAITFREALLLYDPERSSARTRQLVTEVISHEIAHQWFGNLVTMKWWNDLWLNESFATLMATKFVDQLYPEFDMWNQFNEDVVGTAMRMDGLRSTHPIDVRVDSPAQIQEIFDAISYDKGASILLMLERYVGEAAFRDGLKRYLDLHRYGNACGDDLWDAIGDASGLPVKPMMHTWIHRSGFPVLEADRDGTQINLRQGRFQYEAGRDAGDATWHIPVSASAGGRTSKKLMTGATDSMEMSVDGFALINPGRGGFYRVEYPPEDVLRCREMITDHKFSGTDRWALQNDLFAMCLAGKTSVEEYLDFTAAYTDDGYPALTDVVRNLFSIYLIICLEEGAHRLRDRIRTFLAHVHGRLGWEPEPGERHTDTLLRSLAITALGVMGDPAVFLDAAKRFRHSVAEQKPLPADLQESIYSVVAGGGNGDTSETLRRLYRGAGSQEEKHRVLRALGYFEDARILAGNLDFALTDEVRSQDTHMLIVAVATNPHSRGVFWPWLVSRWSDVVEKVGRGNPLLARIVSCVSTAAAPSMEGEIRRFFTANPAPGTEKALEQALERARINHGLLVSVQKAGGPSPGASGEATEQRLRQLREMVADALLGSDIVEEKVDILQRVIKGNDARSGQGGR